MKELTHIQITVMCDSSHFDLDLNLVLHELKKKFGSRPESVYKFHEVCQVIKNLLS